MERNVGNGIRIGMELVKNLSAVFCSVHELSFELLVKRLLEIGQIGRLRQKALIQKTCLIHT